LCDGPKSIAATRKAPSKPRLEIRLVGNRDVLLEQMLVVLGADFLVHRTLNVIIRSASPTMALEGK
jgi:hypothetical protein